MANDDYEVKRRIIGKPKVAYKCAKCQHGLESDLADAGTTDTCPLCKAQFVVPGERELKEMQDAERQAEVERLREQEARRQKAADEKARKEQLAIEKAQQREERKKWLEAVDERRRKQREQYEEELRAQELQEPSDEDTPEGTTAAPSRQEPTRRPLTHNQRNLRLTEDEDISAFEKAADWITLLTGIMGWLCIIVGIVGIIVGLVLLVAVRGERDQISKVGACAGCVGVSFVPILVGWILIMFRVFVRKFARLMGRLTVAAEREKS